MTIRGNMQDRPTPDLIVVFLAGIIGIIIVLCVVGVVVVEIVDNDNDTSEAVRAITDVTSTLIGAVLGYLAGRQLTRPGRQITEDDDPSV